jgi:hypothetical protein
MPPVQENVIIIWHNESFSIWLDQKASLKITAVPLFLLSKDTKFLNYQNAEILLTAAKKGRDVTKRDRYRNRDGRRR